MKTKMFVTLMVVFLMGVIACGVAPRVLEQAALTASPTPTPQSMPAESDGQDIIIIPPSPVSSVMPTGVDQGPPVASSAKVPESGEMMIYPDDSEAGEMMIYPPEYVAYQEYLDVIGGKPGRADTGVIEATVISINRNEVCPYQEETCRIEPYPSDWGVVRVDNIVSYSPYGGQVPGEVEEPGEADSPPGGRTAPGNIGSGQQPERAKYGPLQAGGEVQTLFLLTTRPAKVRSAPITEAEDTQAAQPPEGDAQTTVGHQVQPGETVFKPIPREEGYFVFFPRLADSSGTVEAILPGLAVGSRFRAEIHYNGTLYVGEYEMLP